MAFNLKPSEKRKVTQKLMKRKSVTNELKLSYFIGISRLS